MKRKIGLLRSYVQNFHVSLLPRPVYGVFFSSFSLLLQSIWHCVSYLLLFFTVERYLLINYR